jgi:hypothetical protein
MNTISLLVMALSSIFCVLFRQSMNPILLAMVFQQLIGLHGCMIGLLHTMADMEKQMVSIGRCFGMFLLPQEEKG